MRSLILIGTLLGPVGLYAQTLDTAKAPATLVVRAGVHDDFERIVFDWSLPPLTVLRQNGQEVLIRFTAKADVNTAPILRRRLTAVTRIEQVPDTSGTTLRLFLGPQKVASYFTDGGRVIIDFRDGIPPEKPDAAPQGIPPALLIAAETPAATPVAVPPVAAPTPTATVTEPQAGPSAPASPVPSATEGAPPVPPPVPSSSSAAGDVAPPAAPEEPEKEATADEEAETAPVKTEEQLKRESEAREKTLKGDDSTISATAFSTTDKKVYVAPELGTIPAEGLPLVLLDPGLVTGAAIFRRADFVYIVFDKKLGKTIAELQQASSPVKLEEVDAIGGSAYRFYLPQDVSLRVARENGGWEVFAAPKTRTAPISLSINPQPDYALGARLLIPLGRPGDTVRMYDPEVGDQLLIVPLTDVGQAVRQSYTYTDLQFIPSEQGIVVRPRIDGVEIKRQTQGLEVIATGGLHLSSERDTGLTTTDTTTTGGARLFDFNAWYGPKNVPYTELRQKWERALSEVPDNERDRVRLEMARFFFARGRPQEAVGLLNLLVQRIPDIDKRSEFLALRGAVRVLGRVPEGLNDLAHAEIRDHPEIKLWRAVGETQATNWKAAAILFEQSDTVLANYPDPLFVDFSLLAIDASLAADSRVYASTVLDRLVQRKPDMEKQSPAVNFLRGVFMSLSGHLDRAEILWKAAASGGDRLFRVRAELALTDLYVVQSKIKPLKAAEKLERLRYAWRGDDLELDILRRMGKFYIEAGKVEEGLSALKQVLAFLPDNQAARDLRQEMAQVFRDVFLSEQSSKISALDALSLYERFYELAPAGEEGDGIIRRLAERMVAVDLLDRAAGLLADQVRRRLTGELKGKVGTQAAGIYLLDHKPEAAITILNESDDPAIPEDIRKERVLLKAKALSEQNQNEAAMQLLGEDKDEFAMRLKADISWRARDWGKAAAFLEPLVKKPDDPEQKLKAKDAQLIINRAIALAMANDNAGLDKLRADFAPVLAGTPQADLFRILTQPETGLPRDQNAMQSFMADVDLFSEYLESYRNFRADTPNTLK